MEFDASTGRWRVRLAEPDGRELALRASNLAVLMPACQMLLALGEMPCGADVEMHSLVRSSSTAAAARWWSPKTLAPGGTVSKSIATAVCWH